MKPFARIGGNNERSKTMGISNYDEIATDTPKRKRVVSVWRIGGGIVMLAVIALLSQLIIVNPGTGGTVGIDYYELRK